MRLIDGDKLIENAFKNPISYTAFCNLVKRQPTVDAVPVVRCKDCKHHHYSECEIPYCDRIDYGYGWKDDDFCSHGERKDGDEHES